MATKVNIAYLPGELAKDFWDARSKNIDKTEKTGIGAALAQLEKDLRDAKVEDLTDSIDELKKEATDPDAGRGQGADFESRAQNAEDAVDSRLNKLSTKVADALKIVKKAAADLKRRGAPMKAAADAAEDVASALGDYYESLEDFVQSSAEELDKAREDFKKPKQKKKGTELPGEDNPAMKQIRANLKGPFTADKSYRFLINRGNRFCLVWIDRKDEYKGKPHVIAALRACDTGGRHYRGEAKCEAAERFTFVSAEGSNALAKSDRRWVERGLRELTGKSFKVVTKSAKEEKAEAPKTDDEFDDGDDQAERKSRAGKAS